MKLLNQVDTTQRRHTYSLSLSHILSLTLSLSHTLSRAPTYLFARRSREVVND